MEKYVQFDQPVKAAKIRIQANEGKGSFASMVGVAVYGIIK